MSQVEIQGNIFDLVMNHKNGWNPDAFSKRYSDVLGKYDFIVGDWGYGQLRLKGFFSEKHPRATRETRITHVEEYLHEYCNFGCAYFVLQRVSKGSQGIREKKGKPKERRVSRSGSSRP
ncbi:YutD family protein [Marininema halotolerans]|uniref:Uncharacterized protein YutD n=1 Tax=Marininema halotolerans TaxID=1155944 RepID=A0A1I6RLF0_9BACL|nr:YutD family protein [Marininema halotolerans]SFS65583.1 Uncharacterized protein YutD [Marininema halotolerans]